MDVFFFFFLINNVFSITFDRNFIFQEVFSYNPLTFYFYFFIFWSFLISPNFLLVPDTYY